MAIWPQKNCGKKTKIKDVVANSITTLGSERESFFCPLLRHLANPSYVQNMLKANDGDRVGVILVSDEDEASVSAYCLKQSGGNQYGELDMTSETPTRPVVALPSAPYFQVSSENEFADKTMALMKAAHPNFFMGFIINRSQDHCLGAGQEVGVRYERVAKNYKNNVKTYSICDNNYFAAMSDLASHVVKTTQLNEEIKMTSFNPGVGVNLASVYAFKNNQYTKFKITRLSAQGKIQGKLDDKSGSPHKPVDPIKDAIYSNFTGELQIRDDLSEADYLYVFYRDSSQ